MAELEVSAHADAAVAVGPTEEAIRPFVTRAPGAPTTAAGWLAPVGRTFMILAGAFLLRALTESGRIAMPAGVWLGLLYALVWLVFAERSRGLAAQLYGLSTLLVALPLISEAALSTHLKYFTASSSSGTLAVVTMATLAVAWRRQARTLAGLAAAGAIVVAFTLGFAFDAFVWMAPILILLSVTAIWMAHARGWGWMAWPTALAVDAAILLLTARAMSLPSVESPMAAQIIVASFLLMTVGSIVARLMRPGEVVQIFDVLQTTASLLLGLLGLVALERFIHFTTAIMATASLALGAGLFLMTITTVARRTGFGANFYYFGMTALALVLTGVSLLMPFPDRPVLVAVIAFAAMAAGQRLSNPMLTLQGGIAAIVAAAQCGLVAFAARVWLTPDQGWPVSVWPMIVVLVAVTAALWIPRAADDRASMALLAATRVALSTAFVAGAGSIALTFVSPWLAGSPADIGVLATVKSVLLAISIVALARAGRSARFIEFRWIGYAVLALGGIKILVEDFRVSQPATIFIALAAYGAALIVLARDNR